MTPILKTAAAAALTSAALFAQAPAGAHDSFSVSIGVPGVAFTYDSGGFCDHWGCPGDYWGYPVYYGPVFFDGVWFNGPVYYREVDGDYWYWVHGGWHRDEWRGPHPGWWGHYHYGPALGYSFYAGHGFHHGRDPFWHGDHWDNGNHRGWDRHDGGDRVRFDEGDRGRHDGDGGFPRGDDSRGHRGDHGDRDRGDHDRGGGHGHGHGHGG